MLQPTRKIVAVGGGDVPAGATLAIDRRITALTGKKRPRALLIPTASGDPENALVPFQRIYGKRLRCETDVLFLLRTSPRPRAIRDTILGADIVYVPGGNTLQMMRRWRHLGVDRVLRDAWRRGVVLAGVSAGAICWFASGHSDSMAYYHPDDWQYIRVRGLGFLSGSLCPHYNKRTRVRAFRQMMARRGGLGLGVQDCCAVEFVDDRYRMIASKPTARAFRLVKRKGKIVSKAIPQRRTYSPIAELCGQE